MDTKTPRETLLALRFGEHWTQDRAGPLRKFSGSCSLHKNKTRARHGACFGMFFET
jgi:hypothetical protein